MLGPRRRHVLLEDHRQRPLLELKVDFHRAADAADGIRQPGRGPLLPPQGSLGHAPRLVEQHAEFSRAGGPGAALQRPRRDAAPTMLESGPCCSDQYPLVPRIRQPPRSVVEYIGPPAQPRVLLAIRVPNYQVHSRDRKRASQTTRSSPSPQRSGPSCRLGAARRHPSRRQRKGGPCRSREAGFLPSRSPLSSRSLRRDARPRRRRDQGRRSSLESSGPFAAQARQIASGAKAYMKAHGDTVAGKKIELIVKDTSGPAPDVAKRLAQELVTRDKVQFLAGFGSTPNALAVAPVATRGQGADDHHERGDVVDHHQVAVHRARVVHAAAGRGAAGGVGGQEQDQAASTRWSADYGPGIDAEATFKKVFTAHGGEIVGSVRVPLQEPRLLAVHPAHQGREAGGGVRVRARRRGGGRLHEGVRRARPGQGGHQADRHRRPHRRRRARLRWATRRWA